MSLCDCHGCLREATHQVSVWFMDGVALPGFTFGACYEDACRFAVAVEAEPVSCWFDSVTDDAGDSVMVGDDADEGPA